MKNIQKILDKLSALQEMIVDRATEICTKEDITAKELSSCAKIVRDVCDVVIKYCVKSSVISSAINKENSIDDGKEPLVKDVYDIMMLEDVLQEARERFKDDLYLIEHHQNSIDVIKRAKAYVDRVIAETDTADNIIQR
jgi:hypothetical protein